MRDLAEDVAAQDRQVSGEKVEHLPLSQFESSLDRLHRVVDRFQKVADMINDLCRFLEQLV